MTDWEGKKTRGEERRRRDRERNKHGEEGQGRDREGKSPAEVIVFPKPAPKAPALVYVVPSSTSPDPDDGRLELVNRFGIRAVLRGPIGRRWLEIYQHNEIEGLVDNDDEAMELAEMAMALTPDDRAIFFLGLVMGLNANAKPDPVA